MITKQVTAGFWILLALLAAAPAAAQSTDNARDTRSAYGARLLSNGEDANANSRRINNRLTTRIDNRVELRTERYAVGTVDAAAAVQSAASREQSAAITRSPDTSAPQ